MKVPPITIQFMLACYYSADPAAELGATWFSSAGGDARAWLRNHDLVDNQYRPTSRGDAWVQFICATPLPQQQWILPPRAEQA